MKFVDKIFADAGHSHVIECMQPRFEVSLHLSFTTMAQSELTVCVHYSKVRGYHIYKDIWEAPIGEVLTCRKEEGNVHDPYFVAVIDQHEVTIGHVPREISAICSLFLDHRGTISCKIIGRRKYSEDLPQGGFEIHCKLCFTGPAKYVDKVKVLLPSVPKQMENFEEKGKDGRSDLKKEIAIKSSETEKERCPGEPVESRIWLHVDGQHLLYSDWDILQEGGHLNDRHINYAQKLLKLLFPCLEGLNLTLYQSKEQKSN